MSCQRPTAVSWHRATRPRRRVPIGARAGAALLGLMFYSAAASAADDIVVGASIPLSGPLAGFGSFQQWGYKRAVDEVNKAGGIAISGTKQQVKLIIRDDKTDPNATAANTET